MAEAEENPVEVDEETMPGEVVTQFSGAFAGNSRYTIVGEALVLNDGTEERFLRFENFESSNGPDLKVYLRAENDEFISLGALKGNIGDQNYTIPVDADLEVFSSVEIWCERFGVSFGQAEARSQARNQLSHEQLGHNQLGSCRMGTGLGTSRPSWRAVAKSRPSRDHTSVSRSAKPSRAMRVRLWIEDEVVDRLGQRIPEVDGQVHRWRPNPASLPPGHRRRPGIGQGGKDEVVDGRVIGTKPTDGFGSSMVVLMGATLANRMS